MVSKLNEKNIITSPFINQLIKMPLDQIQWHFLTRKYFSDQNAFLFSIAFCIGLMPGAGATFCFCLNTLNLLGSFISP